ncbi:LHFPL tetraspan subfamily member 3 protein-like [Oratosquilla oratoria]|uniref:LHFPL tetraspan subfamily member 3 protein-like n=1 Tax=Oratosquilla oratoria TaxID=337810 RepID=UPI003F7735DD
MEKKPEFVDRSQVYRTTYARNSKAIGVLWGVFTLCFAIIDVVVFVQPQWMGDTQSSKGTGQFGLWQKCIPNEGGGEPTCTGKLDDFNSFLNMPAIISTVFAGLSMVLVLLCIICMLLFFFCKSSTVFHICGWMQVFSAVCLLVGILVFPVSWDSPEVREVCGPSARIYNLGECGLRWAFFLAVIGVFDAVVLAALALILATRTLKPQVQPEPIYVSNGSVYKGQMNPGFVGDAGSMAGSRKSLNLQPVMLMPHPDHDSYSEFSHHTARSKNSAYRAQYASSVQNFQL